MKTPAPHVVALMVTLAGCAARRGSLPQFASSDPVLGVGLEGPATEVLQAMAADVDGGTRAAALDVLVRAAAEPAGGAFGVAAIWDPEPWVQRSAVEALASRLSEAESIERLTELATRAGVDPHVRCRAAYLLPAPVEAPVSQAVRESWTTAPIWKSVPCAAADASGGATDAAARLVEALEQGALALEPTLVPTLSTLKVEGLDAAIVRGLDSADDVVRPMLVATLLARGNPAALDALRANLSDPDPLVRMEAVELLSEVHQPGTDQLLAKAASSPEEPEGSVALMVLAARTGGSFRTFEDAFAGDNRDLRRAAVRFGSEHVARQEAPGGGRSARKRLERLLAQALVDPDPTTRERALQATGRLQIVGLQTVVEALLGDAESDDRLRVHAAEALLALQAVDRP